MAEHPRRTQIVHVLREAARPLGVGEVAEVLGVHPNTVRFHLDALVADRQVERTMHQPEGPGRPRALYAPTPGMDRAGARDYRLLARILASSLSAHGPAAAAESARVAGRAWGRHLIASPAPFRQVSEAEATQRLTGLLDALGFAPEPGTGDQAELLRLRHCPFLELAEEFGTVVCPLHLGLMQGALEELGAPVTAAGLEPFGEPDACLVRLEPAGARSAGAARAQRGR